MMLLYNHSIRITAHQNTHHLHNCSP